MSLISRIIILILLVFFLFFKPAFSQVKIENLIFITMDGMRWQEVFNGMDSSLANNPKYNQGSKDQLFQNYWSDNISARRSKLMPFLWSVLASKGQIYGNRNYENFVNVANPYWFSYPGYSELFCGYIDTVINSNNYVNNPNINFFEFLNKIPNFKNKIALFGDWAALPYMVNADRSEVIVSSAYKPLCINITEKQKLINSMLLDSYSPWGKDICSDLFVFYQGFEYLKAYKPRVFYLLFGETDEWAHEGCYKNYLDIVNTTDKWISQIWSYIQTDEYYKNKTLIFITCDHGRGVNELWTSHNKTIPFSDQSWFAIMGPGFKPIGELKGNMQIFNKQFAKTICSLLGYNYVSKDTSIKSIEIPVNQ